MPAAKKPEDHKAKSESFVWTAPDGSEVTFKPFGKLPIGVFRALRGAEEIEAIFIMLDAAVKEKDREILDAQPFDELEGIIDDWQKSSGVTPGES